MLWEDIVKDDSGAFAVFTEQGSSASQMTAKIMDVIARLPGCDGQAVDAVSTYTQIARNSKIGMSRCLDTCSRTQLSKIMGKNEDPVPLERNLYGHPLPGCCGRDNSNKLY